MTESTRKKPRPRSPRRIAAPPAPAAEVPPNVFALDISSTAVGFAVFASGGLVECGVIAAKDLPIESRAEDLASRTWLMLDKQGRLASTLVVAEAVSGRHGGAKPYAVAQVAFAQGAIWQRIGSLRVKRERVAEVDWMRGFRGKLRDKQKRAEWLAATEAVYRDYRDRRGDPGCDAADAVALGLWRLGKIGGKDA